MKHYFQTLKVGNQSTMLIATMVFLFVSASFTLLKGNNEGIEPSNLPIISGLSNDNRGFTGGTIKITGTGFTGTTSVTFGGTEAGSFTVDTDTQISAVLGAGSSGDVVVTNGIGSGSYSGFIYVDTSVLFERAYTGIKCNGIAADNSSVCNSRGNCTAADTCACDGRYGGTDCQTLYIFKTGLFTTESRLEFSGPPTLYDGFKMDDPLAIYIFYLRIENVFVDRSKSKGMVFGIISGPELDTTHDVGDYKYEYGYTQTGEIQTEGVLTPFGVPLKREDTIRFEVNMKDRTINVWVREGEDSWSKMGGGEDMFENFEIHPDGNLRMAYSVLCFGTCIATFVPQ
jgi:hypothetical protein